MARAQPLRSTLDNESSDRKGFLQGLAGLGLAVTAAMAAPAPPAQAASLAKVGEGAMDSEHAFMTGWGCM